MKKFNAPTLINLRRQLRKGITPQERALWNILRNRKIQGLKFFRQYSVNNYILDFYCPKIKLCIEIDGGQHSESKNKIADIARSNYLNSLNIKILRFWNNEIDNNLEGTYEKII